MKYDGRMFFSPKYDKRDWEKLQLNINSSSNDWDTAIDMFIDRVNARYFNQISVLEQDFKNSSFIIASLDCLLIETFSQFFNGTDSAPVGQSGAKYIGFLTNNCFPGLNYALAEYFYKNVRCGLLHSAQTKGKSYLSISQDALMGYDNNNYFYVSVDLLTEALRGFFNRYTNELRNNNCKFLRKNFIKKMNYIVNR